MSSDIDGTAPARTTNAPMRLGPPHIHHDWDAEREPALWLESGGVLTLDLPSGEGDQLTFSSTSEDLHGVDWSQLHALVGPVGLRGLLPGEAVQIDVLDLRPASWGFVMHRPGIGMLASPAPFLRTLEIDGAVARFGDLALPIAPMLGVVGVAPAHGVETTRSPGVHGGNMDASRLKRGAAVLLPVFVPGGLVSFGDPHALQGDGEVCVTGLECAMTATVRLTRRTDIDIELPVIEDDESIHFIGHGHAYEEAAAVALQSAVDWLRLTLLLDFNDAYALASLTVDMGVSQLVNEPIVGAMATVHKTMFGLGPSVLRTLPTPEER